MKKIMFIGKTGSGKTTLCQKLNDLKLEYKKTQAVEWYDNAIDTPGEFLESRHYYSALIMTAADADLIALVGDPTVDENFIPPAFSGSFTKDVIGIVTKISLVENSMQLKKVEEKLREAGAQRVFFVDTVENKGIEPLFAYLEQTLMEDTTLPAGKD